jgi:3-hydroxybutyryl-CoA dehydrogenase
MDIAMAGNETMYNELGSETFRPPRCLIMKFRAGELGKKTGRGFYEYG